MSTATCTESAIRQAREVVERICAENYEFYRDPRGMGALKELQQTFPHPWLYVAELLQNAVDARAKRIAVTIANDRSFIFEHDGNAFVAENTTALCMKGVSTKGANTVGFMGIGFKSVFQSYQKAQISSGDFRFALNVSVTRGEEYGDLQRNWIGSVLPEWDEQALPPSAGMTCCFVLSNRLPRLEPPSHDLEHAIGDSETLLALLAWQGVTELRWNGKLWLLDSRETSLNENGDCRVRLTSLDEATNIGRQWILFYREYQPSRQAIARFLEHRQLTPSPDKREEVYAATSKSRRVAVFCEIDEDGSPAPPARGSAYALLPTGVTFPLGLHVQADWLLVVSRRELMQVEGNEWHEEILDQLPRLIRYVVEWVVDRKENPGEEWGRGYQALPDLPRPDLESDAWFATERFLRNLRLELEPLSFLPKLTGREASSEFLSPSEGRVLPKPFVKDFEDPVDLPHLLFGDRIVSSSLLGLRAMGCLEQLELLHELRPTELTEHWRTGAVKSWLNALYGEQLQPKMLCDVLKALTGLDDKQEWKTAPLICLPTEGGTWTNRQEIARYPADWNILAQEDEIRASLEQFLSSTTSLLSWELEVVLRQLRVDAQPYLQGVAVPRLETLVDQWWESLPELPSDEQIGRITRFAAWVLKKQPQRKTLVQKLLAAYTDLTVHLVEPKDVLLAEPYAGTHRRLFFRGKPVVTPHYENCGEIVDRADWRAFFETLTPAPAGRFALTLRSQEMSYFELKQFVGGDYSPPLTRSTRYSTTWKGLPVWNNSYSVVDVELPASLTAVLNASVTKEQFTAIVNWLSEFPTQFSEYAALAVAYIPYGSGYVNTIHLTKPARWLVDLGNVRWVYSTSGDGPFRPCDMLSSPDLARPNAPVAHLPSELLQSLKSAGLAFGTALPDAPAVDRLRIQGPTASANELFDLLQQAIAEVGRDEQKSVFLQKILKEAPLFPFPRGRVAVDGVVRVPHGRVVWSEKRSTFNNWLTAIDAFADDSPERKTLSLLDSVLPVAKTTSFAQSLDFLTWVWSEQPDADRVRGFLPRAYQYVAEAVKENASARENWKAVLSSAAVFLQGKRRWVAVAASQDLFLDDVQNTALESALRTVDLATAGHFAETIDEQIAIACLLGLPLLSSRFRIEVKPVSNLQVPEHWQAGFEIIQNWLREQLSKPIESDAESVEKGVPTQNLKLSHWQTLQTVVFDTGQPVEQTDVRAVFWMDGTIAVSGNPDDFAEELCTVLFSQWGLLRRRGMVKVSSSVAVKLTKIGDSAAVARWKAKNLPGGDKPSEKMRPSPDVPATTATSTPNEPNGDQSATSPDATEPSTEPEKDSESVGQDGSFTAEDREARLRYNILKKEQELAQLKGGVAADVIPDEASTAGTGEFHSDDAYRRAAMKYEEAHGRFPVAKGATQSGHDLDSFSHPEAHADRTLVRRIEVKGRGTKWDDNEIVAMSSIQFKDAMHRTVRDGESTDTEFDYWLYVVELAEGGELRVLPIRNVAMQSGGFCFRGGTWRHLAEQDEGESGTEAASSP